MRTFCGAVLLCFAAATASHAADQSAVITPGSTYYPNVYPTTYDPVAVMWTGFYFGADAGGVFGSAHWTDPFSGDTDSLSGNSVFGGGHVGVNFQHDWLVLGAEGDFDWMSLNGNTADALGYQHSLASHWMSTFTGRLGFAYTTLLFYLKGGIAFISERDLVQTPRGFGLGTGTETRDGWTIGGGVEWAFDPHWSARLEYDFVSIVGPGEQFAATGGTISPSLSPAYGNVDLTISKLEAGVSFRF